MSANKERREIAARREQQRQNKEIITILTEMRILLRNIANASRGDATKPT